MRTIRPQRLWRRIGLVLAAVLVMMTLVSASSSAGAPPPQNPQTGSAGLEGTVQTPPPKIPATITTPRDGQSFNQMPITIAGTCTTDLLVKIFSNNVFVGSAICKNGSYSLQVNLFDGRNEVVARIFDALDQAGPDSAVVTLTYNNTQFVLPTQQLTLSSPYARRGANPGEQLVWPITINGGVAPYAVSVDWGDGKGSTLYSESFAGTFNVQHVYDHGGIYVVIIRATDKNGQTAYLQLVGQANGAVAQSGASSGNFAVLATTQTKVSWLPLIIAVPLILLAFWLGRRYELTELRKHLEGLHD